MKKKVSSASSLLSAAVVVAVVVAVVLLGEAGVTEGAVTCNPSNLRPCIEAITTKKKPSRTCCEVLRVQRPCLCEYIKDPQYGQWVKSPNAKKITVACGVPRPAC